MCNQFIYVKKLTIYLLISFSMCVVDSLLAQDILSEPVVCVHDKEIIIYLTENISISLLKEGDIVKGINHLKINHRQVLSPPPEGCGIPVMAIITDGEIESVKNWVAYLKERKEECGESGEYPGREGLEINRVPIIGEFTGWRTEENGVCISIKLEKGVAEWIIMPASEVISGGIYTGIRWKLRLKDISRVYEIVVEEPIAFDVGDWKLAQVWEEDFPKGSVDWKMLEELQMGDPREYSLPERGYFSWQQPFFSLAGKSGSIVSFFESVVHASVGEMKKMGIGQIGRSVPHPGPGRRCNGNAL